MDDPRKQRVRRTEISVLRAWHFLSSGPLGTSDSWATDQGSDGIWKEAWKGVWMERLTPAFSEAQENTPHCPTVRISRVESSPAGYPRPPPTSAWPFPLPPAPRKPIAHPEAGIIPSTLDRPEIEALSRYAP